MKVNVPLFSVIVPVYNNEWELKRCIGSILKQSFSDFELIIVDDGSTDHTPQICDWFVKQDTRVKVIHRIVNGGVVTARNDGLFQALGKYIYYVDGDDWIDSKLLEMASLELCKEEAPDIFAFGHVRVQEGRRRKNGLKVRKGIYDKERLKRDVYPEMICRVGKTIQHGIDSGALWDKVIRKELLKEHYCKNTDLFRGEDSVCAWECLYYAKSIYFSDLCLYFYDCTSNSSGKKKYHPSLYENNKAVAAYLRLHLHAEKDFQIARQINALEFRGMVGVIHQEIDYFHFICSAATFLKEKCKDETEICSGNGLPLSARLYILLINRKCFMFLLLCIFTRYCIDAAVCTLKKLFRLCDDNGFHGRGIV